MSIAEIAGLVLALLVMGVGVVGCVVPGIPGTPLVLGAAIVHKLVFGAHGAAWWVLVLLVIITALAEAVERLASLYGARRLGATWRGVVGALVGGLAGLFFLPIGILVGPFLGAFLLELAGRRHWKDASKAGAGATLGLLCGAATKVAASMVMALMFLVNVAYRSLT